MAGTIDVQIMGVNLGRPTLAGADAIESTEEEDVEENYFA
jgi:hypothetical protein